MNKPQALNNVRVVLSNTTHPGNIGAAARAMKTMGLRDLRLVAPRRFPDAEAEAMAAGAADLLASARVCGSLEDALGGCVRAAALSARRRDVVPEVMTPREAARELAQVAQCHPVALVFGAEASGLTVEEVDRCQMLVQIPADSDYPALNLAAAVQVMAYELRLAAGGGMAVAMQAGDPAPLAESRMFYAELEETLLAVGYLDAERSRRIMQRLRRMFSRARLERDEVGILRGVLKAVRRDAQR